MNEDYKSGIEKNTDDGIKEGKPGASYESVYSSVYSYIRRVNPLWEVGAKGQKKSTEN